MKAVVKFIGSVLLGIVILWFAAFLLLGGPRAAARRRHFDRLVKTADHSALLKEGAGVIQAATNYTTYHDDRDPSLDQLPKIIRDMAPHYVSVDTNHLRMEFHGGMDHYGFEIRRGKDWGLYWYTEGGRNLITLKPIR